MRLVSFFFLFIFISWRLITLQYCSGFCHTLKGTPESSLAPSAKWGYNEKMFIPEQGSGLSLVTDSASVLILDFAVSRIMRNKCLLFKPPNLWYSVIVVQTKTISLICVGHTKSLFIVYLKFKFNWYPGFYQATLTSRSRVTITWLESVTVPISILTSKSLTLLLPWNYPTNL